MNIFVTNNCPAESAKYLDNKRCIKMTTESAQLLSNALHYYGFTGPYKATHMNHPCSIWTRTNRENYTWVLEHMKALCKEYTRRYDKIHKCESLVLIFEKGKQVIPNGALTNFINCARSKERGLDFTKITSVTEAYKKYLAARWKTDKRAPKWN